MTNTISTDPVWQYESEALALSDTQQFHLILWKYGLSCVGFSPDGNPIIASTYLFEKEWDTEQFKEILINEPVFAGPQPIRSIWVAEERQLLVPAPFFQENFADVWLRTFHFMETDEHLEHHSLSPGLDAHAVFPFRGSLLDLIQEYLPEAKIRPLSLLAFYDNQETKPEQIQIINLPKLSLWSFVEDGQFQHHQISSAEAPENILYALAAYLQESGHLQQSVSISLEGIAPFWKNLHLTLKDFFSQLEIQEDTTAISLEFYKKLFKCA